MSMLMLLMYEGEEVGVVVEVGVEVVAKTMDDVEGVLSEWMPSCQEIR